MTAVVSGLRVQLLGTFTIRRDGQALPALRTRKEAWLLALLVLKHPQPMDRAWLAGALWPDSDEAQARYNLRRSLSNLRAALGPDAFRLTEPVPHTLGLNLAGAWVDLLAFDAAIRRSDSDSLQEAVALYNGALLEDCGEAWALGERVRREQAFLCALETLAEEAMGGRQWDASAGLLRRVLDSDPLRENAVQNLMRCRAGGGDIPGALETYRDFRLLLIQELQAEPNAQTRLLYRQLKEGQINVDTATPPVRLTALQRPATSLHLPHPMTELIGREAEVEAICRDLQAARLVTLTGAGGIGKTRLAIASAARCADHFRDGVWFVDLTAVEDVAHVAQAIAQTLHVQEDPQRTALETLAQALPTRELLVVLDNCEHLIAACAKAAYRLLHACPHLRLLATSRQSLGLPGERVRQIPPLSLPPIDTEPFASDSTAGENYARIEESAAVRLFVERATAASAAFALTPQNAQSVAQICHRLEGAPFALELAAAWVKALEAAQIAARLSDPLSLPQRDYVPGGAHRHTLRAMLAWSYSLLSAPEQTLLRQLSVFVGGWSLEAAEQVCGDILTALTGLVDKSLVVYENRNGTERYRLLDTTRAFARELLSEAEREAVVERHAAYFRRRAAEVRADRDEGRNLRRNRVWTRLEQANCLAALARFQERDAEAALAFRLDLHAIELLSYHTPEMRAWIAEVSADPDPPQTPLSADLYCRLGQCALWIGENAIGRKMLEQAIAIAEACGASRVLAYAAHPLGMEELDNEQYDQAQRHLEQALEHSERADASRQAAICRDALSWLAYLRGDREEAWRIAECSRRFGEERQDARILTEAAWRQAWLASREQRREDALRFLQEYVALLRRSESQPLDAAFQKAGGIAYAIGEFDSARQYLEEALHASRENGNRSREGWVLDTLAVVALAQGDDRQAAENARRSLRLFHDLGERGSTSAILARLGQVYARQGDGARELTLLAHIEAAVQRQPSLHTPDFIRTLHARAAAWKEKLDPPLFAAAWNSGWHMTLDQAVAFALHPAAQ